VEARAGHEREEPGDQHDERDLPPPSLPTQPLLHDVTGSDRRRKEVVHKQWMCHVTTAGKITLQRSMESSHTPVESYSYCSISGRSCKGQV
jgi:hypothetical protein